MSLSYQRGRLKRFYDAAPIPIQHAMTTLYGARLAARVYRRHFRRHCAELERTQWLGVAELQRLQLERLRALLDYAERHSEYWRATLSTHGVRGAALRALDELGALPPLAKETVRACYDALLTGPARTGELPMHVVHTSGTTGAALRVAVSHDAFVREHAFRWQHRSWGGVRRGERTATLAGHPVVPIEQDSPPYWRYNATERQLLFSAQHVAAETLPHYVARLRTFRPVLVHGYPSALWLLAAHLVERDDATIRPRAVVTHSETLLDHQHDAIARAFGCRVFDWYGTSEHAANIVSCERGSRHIRMEHSIVEVLRADGSPASPGENGEIVATPLANLAMPLVRYRTGDIAVPAAGECACGRAGPLVERVLGRVEDFIVTPEGRRAGRLDHAFKKATNVAEAQLVQHTIDALDVSIVPRAGFGEADRAAIEAELRLRLGSTIAIRFHTVDRIARTAAGKVRFAVSHVPGAAITAVAP
jgi:phenylacetate-CoA ligase